MAVTRIAEAVGAMSIDNQICLHPHSSLIFPYMPCKSLMAKFLFSTAIPGIDQMHTVPGTFPPRGHLFAVACHVQPPAKCFLSYSSCLQFQATAAAILRPTLSLAPALSGLFEDVKNRTPNAEQIVPFVAHRHKNRWITF